MAIIRYDKITNGHILDQPPHLLPDGFWALAKNVRFRDGRVMPRPGYRQVCSATLPDAPTMLAPFIDTFSSASGHTLVAGTARDLASWDGGYYTTGTATSSSSNATVTFTGADIVAANIRAGDCIRFKLPDETYTQYFTIGTIKLATEATLTTNGYDVTDAEYQILKTWRFITPRHSLAATNILLTNGSPNVDATPSVGGVFSAVKKGDFLYVFAVSGGAYHRRVYEVDSVSTVTNPDDRIILTENWAGATFTATGGNPDGTGGYEIRNTFNGGDTNRWQATMFSRPPNPPSDGTLVARMIFTNLTDNVQKWDGQAYATEDLSPSTPLQARYCANVANHLILAHFASDPFVLRWSNFADPDDFSFDPASTAGGGPVADDPYGITGIHMLQERLIVLQRDAVSVFVPTGTLPAFSRQILLKDYGNELPFASHASKNAVVFLDRDGLFLWDGAGAPTDISERVIWNSFVADINWENREYAFGHYSPADKEFYLFYNSPEATRRFANKAVCFSTTPSEAGNFPFSTWQSAPVAPETTPPFVNCMADWEETLAVTIDTIEEVFDWGPPETIDSMPWSTIDSIGLGAQYLKTWVGTADGKIHRWGFNYSDNGNNYQKLLYSKWMDFGDSELRKLIRTMYFFASPTGVDKPLRVRVFTKFNIIEPPTLRKEFNVDISGSRTLRASMRAPGKWFLVSLEDTADNDWELYGYAFDVVPIGKRDSTWYSSLQQAYWGVTDSSSLPSSPTLPPIEPIPGRTP